MASKVQQEQINVQKTIQGKSNMKPAQTKTAVKSKKSIRSLNDNSINKNAEAINYGKNGESNSSNKNILVRIFTKKVINIISILIVISAVASLFVFDVVGIRTHTLKFANKIIDDTEKENAYKQQIKGLNALVKEQSNIITKKNQQIQSINNQLNQKDTDISNKQQQIDQAQMAVQQAQLQAKSNQQAQVSSDKNIDDIVKIYAKMDADKAAAVLTTLKDSTLRMNIIKKLNKDQAAAILAAMDAKVAAEITNELK